MTPERVIGKDGDLPWHLPEDLKFFKKTTVGAPVIMGRKTYDSIGRPLPKRTNIVLTTDPNWSAKGVVVIHSLEGLQEALLESEKAFVIGGAQVYEQFLPLMDELLISKIKKSYQGNTYFPEYESFFSSSEEIESFEEFSVFSCKK